MKQAVTAEQMKELERFVFEDKGIPDYLVMEQAAHCIAEYIICHYSNKRIMFLCGTGNNGADGLAAARMLFLQNCNVSLYLAGDRKKESRLAAFHRNIAIRCNIPFSSYEEIENSEIIVDALFGIGLSRELTSDTKELVDMINGMHKHVIAIDLPSGINADSGGVMGCAIKADETITFGAYKPGLLFYPGAEYAGKVLLQDIGLTFDLNDPRLPGNKILLYEKNDLKTYMPKRYPASHKGTYGKVLLIAGFHGMTGAAFLSAKAAYRTGTGLVRIVTTEDGANICRTLLPEALISTIGSKDKTSVTDDVNQWKDWCDAVIIGPGIGKGKDAREALKTVLEWNDKKIVFDADALNLLAELLNEQSYPSLKHRVKALAGILPDKAVLTPHKLELSRLLQVDMELCSKEIINILDVCCEDNNIVWVAKDARTITASNKERYINCSGNHGMSTAGSGDVLTGIIAGLSAMGAGSELSASLGTYIHGLARDIAAQKFGTYAMMSGDIVEAIAEVLSVLDQN